MVIFAEVTENECIIDKHLRGIYPLLDYDASESQSMISQRGFSAIAELLIICPMLLMHWADNNDMNESCIS